MSYDQLEKLQDNGYCRSKNAKTKISVVLVMLVVLVVLAVAVELVVMVVSGVALSVVFTSTVLSAIDTSPSLYKNDLQNIEQSVCVSRRGCTPVSTVLRKSVRVFIDK